MSLTKNYTTLKVHCGRTITEINNEIFPKHNSFGVIDFKQWIESFETAKYSEISEMEIQIIVEDIQVEYIKRWFKKHLPESYID